MLFLMKYLILLLQFSYNNFSLIMLINVVYKNLNENELNELLVWLDNIPLSRVKRNIT